MLTLRAIEQSSPAFACVLCFLAVPNRKKKLSQPLFLFGSMFLFDLANR